MIGKFRFIRKIGEGGNGEVFLVRRGKEYYALKIFRSQGEGERIFKVYELIKQLDHPSIVRVFEVGQWEGERYYLLMEYVDGVPLEKLKHRLNFREKMKIAAQIIEVLAYAHSKGILHKDLKLENILITPAKRVKLTDFGLMREEGQTLTHTGELSGTPGYIPPEELKGEQPSLRSDVFALGCVLYELFTGIHPFKRHTVSATLYAVLNQEPVEPYKINPEIPRNLSNLILKCLSKEPEYRYANAEEVLRDFRIKKRIRLRRFKANNKLIFSSLLILFVLVIFAFILKVSTFGSYTVHFNTDSFAVQRNGRTIFYKKLDGKITSYILADIDKDRNKEIVVGVRKDTQSLLYCFSQKGDLKWLEKIEGINNIYEKPNAFLVDRLHPADEKGCIIVGLRNAKWFPYVIKLFCKSARYQAAHTFWNAGWIFTINTYDLNHDGVKDIIAGGINNDMGRKPIVVGLDTKDFHFQSPPWLGKDISEEHGMFFYTLLPGSDAVQEIHFSLPNLRVVTRKGRTYYLSYQGIFTEKDTVLKDSTQVIKLMEQIFKVIYTASFYLKTAEPIKGASYIEEFMSRVGLKYLSHLYPLYSFLYLYQGILFQRSGKFRRAIKSFLLSAKLDTLYAAPFMRLGLLYFEKFDYTKASEYFKRSYQIDGDQWSYFYAMLSEVFQGNYKEGLAMQNNYAKKNDGFYLYFSALLFYAIGQPDSSLIYLSSPRVSIVPDYQYLKTAIKIDLNQLDSINIEGLKKYPDLYGSYLFRLHSFKNARKLLLEASSEVDPSSIIGVIQLWRISHYLDLMGVKLTPSLKKIKKIPIKPKVV